MKDILALNLCPTRSNEINLSLDGVQESRSTNISTDVYSMTFKNCKKVYPFKLIRPINKFKTDDRRHFQDVLEDININSLTINNLIGDKPKRCFFKDIMNQNSTYACEYCESPAIQVRNTQKIEDIQKKYALQKETILSQIEFLTTNPGTSSNVGKIQSLNKDLKKIDVYLKEELKKNTIRHLCWPYSTANGNPRIIDTINEIVNQIETSEGPLDRHDTKGITGKSLLLNIEGFDYICSVPVEYMHSVCLGVVKRFVELTFNVGQTRVRNTKRKLSDPKDFNRLIRNVQVPGELSRRCRNLDFAVLKASEFRNIILFFFPIVVKCIGNTHVKERRLWLQLAFVVRSCVISNEEFAKINKNIITGHSHSFYKNYEKIYGAHNCTYSTHTVLCHILQIRGDEPLTERSAFIYESFYAEMKNLFSPGTISPTKQILRNCFIKRQLQGHQCTNTIKYSKMPSIENINIGKENNHSVYVITEHGHDMYNIIDDNNANTFTCVKQGKFDAQFPELKNVKWSNVGVYKLGPLCSNHVEIPKTNIAGKVIHVDNLLITCPNHVLNEK